MKEEIKQLKKRELIKIVSILELYLIEMDSKTPFYKNEFATINHIKLKIEDIIKNE